MNRQAVQTALGRVVRTRTPITKAQCLATTTAATSRTFTTTPSSRSDQDSSNNDNANANANASGRQKSAQAAAKLGQLIRRAPLDARSLGAGGKVLDGTKIINLRALRERKQPEGAPGPGPARGGGAAALDARSLGAGAKVDGAKVLNLRSLRDRKPGAGGGLGGLARGGVLGLGSSRFNREGGAGGPRRGGPGGGGARFGGRRPGAGGALARRRKFQDANKKKGDRLDDKPVDREWSAAETQLLDRLDQGELTSYTPQATLESLVGYGPALATDNTLAKLESTLRTMRVMGGGRAFDNDPAATVDVRAFSRTYDHEKMPVFFNNKEEKKWLHRALRKKIDGPSETVKQAIIETVVQGKYTAPEFKDITDIKGIVANYQSRQAAYRMSHCQEFTEKLVSMLPAAKGGKAAAPAARS